MQMHRTTGLNHSGAPQLRDQLQYTVFCMLHEVKFPCCQTFPHLCEFIELEFFFLEILPRLTVLLCFSLLNDSNKLSTASAKHMLSTKVYSSSNLTLSNLICFFFSSFQNMDPKTWSHTGPGPT